MALQGTPKTYTREEAELITLMKLLSLDPAKAPKHVLDPENAVEEALAIADTMIFKLPQLKEKALGPKEKQITPLHALLKYNSKRATQERFCNLLVPQKINEKSGGWATIHYLAFNNRADLLAILLEQPGIDIDLQTHQNQSALHLACTQGHHEVVALLLSKNADCYLGNQEAVLPIHKACLRASRSCIELLLKHDPKLASARTIRGRTPAHFFVQHNVQDLPLEDTRAILDLLKPTLDLECNDDTTPLEIAKYLGKQELQKEIELRQFPSLYQLCQQALCKQYNTQDFNEALQYLPSSLAEVLEKKKCRF